MPTRVLAAALALLGIAALGAIFIVMRGGRGGATLLGGGRGGEVAAPGVALPKSGGGSPGGARASLPDSPRGDGSRTGAGGGVLPGDAREALAVATELAALPAPDTALAGRVLVEGARTPVGDARVVLDDGKGRMRQAITDDDGRFELPWWGGHPARLAVAHPAFVDLRLPEAPVGADDLELLVEPSGRIVGRLSATGPPRSAARDPGGEPIAASADPPRAIAWHIAASGQRYWDELAAPVSADGEFLFPDLVPGEYAVTALVVGGVADLVAGVRVEPGGTTSVQLDSGPGAVLTGRVLVRGRGEPVADAVVELTQRDKSLPRDLRALRRTEAVTDEDGAYRCEGLAPGSWVAVVQLPWGEGLRRGFDIPARGAEVELDFEALGAATLTGVVRDADGRGVPGALVTALRRGDGRALGGLASASIPAGAPRAEAGAGGEFRLEEVGSEQRLIVIAWAPSQDGQEGGERGAPGVALAGPLDPSAPEERVEIRLPPELSARGRVLDESGAALPGALVSVERALPGGAARLGAVETDGDGRFELTRLMEGSVRVTASAAGRLPAVESVLLAAGGEPPELELVLPLGIELHGVVVDDRGYGVPDVPVSVQPVSGIDLDEDAARRRRRGTPTDAFGLFHFPELPSGRYLVMASSFEWRMRDDRPFEVTLPRAERLEIEVVPRLRPERASIQGRVVLADGGTPSGLEVQGLQGGVLEIDGGWFRATGLVPTRHRLQISADGHERVTLSPIDLRPRSVHDAGLIELRPVTNLRVRVRDQAGEPVSGARVAVRPLAVSAGGVGADEDQLSLGRAGQGSYGNKRVPRAYWTLRVAHQGSRLHKQVLRVDGAVQEVEVVLAPAPPKKQGKQGKKGGEG